jgi:biopolymer transport protein ExbD
MKTDLSSGGDQEISEINVTPLVDVMLVLLVIFMITVPYMLNGIPLNLPKTETTSALKVDNENFIISVSAAGEIYLEKEKVLLQEVVDLAKQHLRSKKGESIFIRADAKVLYGKVAKLMSQLKSQGIAQISLITEVE